MINSIWLRNNPSDTFIPVFLRRRDLDVTRELIVFGLIFFHTAGIFSEFPFYVKNEPPVPAVTVIVILVSFWGIPILFMIAGFAIWNSLQKRTPGAFVRERFMRLLVPFITGVLLIVPPQMYYALSSDPAYHESYAQFYPRFLDITFNMGFPWFFSAAPESNVFTPANLWFLYVLLLFTLLLLPVFLYLKNQSGRELVGRIAQFTARPWGMLLAAVPIAVIEAALGTDMAGGWNQSAYILFLIYGYFLGADARFWQALRRCWKKSLAFAVVSTVGIHALFVIAESASADPLHTYDLASVALRFTKGIVGWSWIVAILGFIEDLKEKRGSESHSRKVSVMTNKRALLARVERYANEAVLPFYILHQTVIVAIGFYVVQWNTSTLTKFLVISLASLVVTLLVYEIVIKRIKVARLLFGMKAISV